MSQEVLKTAAEWWSEIPEDKNYYKNLDGWNEFRGQKNLIKEWFYHPISAEEFYGRLMFCSQRNDEWAKIYRQQHGPFYPFGIRQLRKSQRLQKKI